MAAVSGELADFGTNEWLVDELHERYLADPSSVDPAWWNFFADYHPGQTETPPGEPAPDQPAQGQPAQGQPAPGQPAQASLAQPNAAMTATPAPVRPGQSGVSDGVSAATVQNLNGPKPAGPQPPADAEQVKLRGAPARTAANMTLSLAVPTATSVRSVPGKLLSDNRIVINN
ncbi:MAG: 2-oxoglutarate dehydrogenase E1 subunit family protein, partial [Streptosporangiaceae bacterium]